MKHLSHLCFTFFLAVPGAAMAQLGNGEATPDCKDCASWSKPQKPFKVYGNTYYVGTAALSSILIVSDQGDILIDGDLNESANAIADHVKALGFKLSDIKLILNSHAHYDHAGGIAQLQRLTGAEVRLSPWSAKLLATGVPGPDDQQFGILHPVAKVIKADTLHDGETVQVGPLALTAHFTPGHTPGGTTWTWRACENGRCLNMVYIDSLSTAAAPNFRFSDHPALLKDFDKSFAVVAALPCDIVLTPHPDISKTMDRLARRDKGEADAFVDSNACRAVAESFRDGMQKRLAQEKAGK
ncbi:MAG TPA: subclass B3 metallo-beta-lactamase [Rhizomicrobium sp.]|nr:subclass B3 metallo-beta-lactamase [Rhizomicrobium sp.]